MSDSRPPLLAFWSFYPAPTRTALEQHFEVVDFAEIEDQDAFFSEHGARFRALATSIVAPTGDEIFSRLPNLEMVASFGVGLEHLDLDAARARGLKVSYTPDVLTDDVADLALLMMESHARGLVSGDRFVRAGHWAAGALPLGVRLAGRRLGILGLGRIGSAIAQRAEARGMHVSYSGPREKPAHPWPFVADLEALASSSDYLVVACNANDDNRYIVSREVLASLGPGGVLVNIARGSLVDEEALVELLNAEALGGALLDVFEREPRVPTALFGMDNVILTPHIGSATAQTRAAMGDLMVRNLLAFFAGEALPSPVD
ncbi:MAG: 2-hydroxyacid dehydrogenase [Halioglobus sp.]